MTHKCCLISPPQANALTKTERLLARKYLREVTDLTYQELDLDDFEISDSRLAKLKELLASNIDTVNVEVRVISTTMQDWEVEAAKDRQKYNEYFQKVDAARKWFNNLSETEKGYVSLLSGPVGEAF